MGSHRAHPSVTKMEEQVKQKMNLWGHAATLGPKDPSASSKYEGSCELMIGFWFGVGVVLAVKS